MAKIAVFSTLSGAIVRLFGDSQTLAEGTTNERILPKQSGHYLVVVVDACRVILCQVMSVTYWLV